MSNETNQRRSFLIGGAATLVALPLVTQALPKATTQAEAVKGFYVETGGSRPDFITHASLNFSEQCKIRSSDTGDRFCLLEQLADRGIGVGLHRHMTADEWFYITAGSFVLEAGGQRVNLGPRETFFIPRGTPHRWISLFDKSSYIFGF